MRLLYEVKTHFTDSLLSFLISSSDSPDDPKEGGASGRRGLFPGGASGGGGGRGGPRQGDDGGAGGLNEQIVVTLLRMQHDMSGVLDRLASLEALVKEQRAVSTLALCLSHSRWKRVNTKWENIPNSTQ